MSEEVWDLGIQLGEATTVKKRDILRWRFGGYGRLDVVNDCEEFGRSSGYSLLTGNIDRCDRRGVIFGANIWHGYGRYLVVINNSDGYIWNV